MISIIIPSFNGRKHLEDFLVSNLKIAQNFSAGAEVVVCDDKSSDNTISLLEDLAAQYHCLKFTVNQSKGICSARNSAVSIASYDNLLFIDNDVLLSETYLEDLKKYITADYFLVACRGYHYYNKESQLDGSKLLDWKRGFPRFTKNIINVDPGQIIESFGVQGAYFLCNKKYFDELNGFDGELLDPYMLEESEFMYRGLKRGYKITYASDLIAWHKCGGTINSKVNPFTKYMSKRNRIIFVWKNIHSKRLLFSNIFQVLVGALNPTGMKALKESLKLLPLIKKKREEEKKYIKVTDLELLRRSKELEQKFKS